MKNKNIILRYIRESDLADYERWVTTETEWCDGMLRGKNYDSFTFSISNKDFLSKYKDICIQVLS